MPREPDDETDDDASGTLLPGADGKPRDSLVRQPAPPFPVVAVGGSAGSLAAFQELLGQLPATAPVALVIISHQDPDRPSLLTEILAKATSMPVSQISENDRAQAGHVHVAPPGRYLSIRDGVFHLERPVERGHPPLPIDIFMRSLSDDRRDGAVGIILSGTGSDGSLGLAAIRDGAGLTLAQPPEEAEFGGMPSAAIAAGVVDLVLSPPEMVERVVAHAGRLAAPPPMRTATKRGIDDLERILDRVAAHTGQDFSAYKRGTLQRRIERRLHLCGQRGLREYLHFLDENPGEIEALWRDWLIGVTGFFRDPDAFGSLESALFELARERPDGSTIRVWVPGCSTGQEAYSIAILLLEAGERLGKRIEPQIFATDLDEAAIDAARAGRYPEGIAAEVSPERLRQFFLVDDRYFVVKKDVRERIVFAVQNLLADPPFTRVDLISCRNLLIYLERDAQKRAMLLFHYSLNPGGLLFLGSSESITEFEDLFSAVDRDHKIFRREETNAPAFTPSDWALTTPGAPRRQAEGPRQAARSKLDLGDVLRRRLADRYAPPSLLIDDQGKVEQINAVRANTSSPLPASRT